MAGAAWYDRRPRSPAGRGRGPGGDHLEEAFHGTTRLVEVDGKRLEVKIPRGVDSGSRIRLAGKGGDGRDLYIVTTVRPHPTFTRKGKDLERELPISLREALIGGEVPVRTLRGRVLLTVPAGYGLARFPLRAKACRSSTDTTGDLIVRTRVVLPTSLSPEARPPPDLHRPRRPAGPTGGIA